MDLKYISFCFVGLNGSKREQNKQNTSSSHGGGSSRTVSFLHFEASGVLGQKDKEVDKPSWPALLFCNPVLVSSHIGEQFQQWEWQQATESPGIRSATSHLVLPWVSWDPSVKSLNLKQRRLLLHHISSNPKIGGGKEQQAVLVPLCLHRVVF